jgi:hypothetical protein
VVGLSYEFIYFAKFDNVGARIRCYSLRSKLLDGSYSLMRISKNAFLGCLVWLTTICSAQTLVAPGTPAEPSGNPAFDNLVAASKIYFRDTTELPMIQISTVTVTDKSGKSRKPNTLTGEYLFHGYSKNTETANATMHFNISLWAAFRGAKMAKSSMNGSVFTMMPGTQMYSENKEYTFEDDAGAQNEPRIKLIPSKPCAVFTFIEMQETYLPQHPCGEMQFDLDTDSKLKKFTYESAGLPAQLKMAPFGNCSLLKYHTEITFQPVTLPDEKAPFLVPAQVVTTLTTDKGTIVLASKFQPKR